MSTFFLFYFFSEYLLSRENITLSNLASYSEQKPRKKEREERREERGLMGKAGQSATTPVT
jgi:hypothetical protein